MVHIEPINVMFLTPDLERGGPELRLLDLAENLPPDVRMFISVTSTSVSLLDRIRRAGVHVEIVPISRAYFAFVKIGEIVRSVRRHRIGIINTFELKGLIIAVCAKLFSGRRVTLVHHAVHTGGYTEDSSVPFRRTIALRFLLKAVDNVVSNSRAAKDLLSRGFFPDAKVELIHNGVDIAKFSRRRQFPGLLRHALGFPDDAFVIGTVANLRKEKEYPFLLAAFRQFAGINPRARLLCVGGGPLLDEMKTLAIQLDVAEKAVFTGYVEDVPGYLGVLDVFVLCSSSEGFPNALIQAMSMGVPVVATAVGDSGDIIEDSRNGFLFRPGDTETFLARVCSLMNNEILCTTIAARARQTVESHYSLSVMVEHYMGHFRTLARRNNEGSQRGSTSAE